jgi:hypothetical protein
MLILIQLPFFNAQAPRGSRTPAWQPTGLAESLEASGVNQDGKTPC